MMAWLEIWLASSLTLLMPLSTGSAGQPRTWPVIGQSVISRHLIGHNSPISCSLYSLEREGVSWMGAGARVEGSRDIREGEDSEPGPAIGQWIRSCALIGRSHVVRSVSHSLKVLKSPFQMFLANFKGNHPRNPLCSHSRSIVPKSSPLRSIFQGSCF